MIHWEEERTNYFGALFFAVLFFLLLTSVSATMRDRLSLSAQAQFKSELTLTAARAVPADVIQIPDVQSSCRSLRYSTHLTLFCETFRLFAAERANAHSLSQLEKKELLIKTIFNRKSICLRIPPPDAEELPILG